MEVGEEERGLCLEYSWISQEDFARPVFADVFEILEVAFTPLIYTRMELSVFS